MPIKLLKIFSLFVATSLFSGCIYLVVGGIGALGGYVVSPDTVEGVAETDDVEVWEATVAVVGVMGTILEQYESAGILIAKVNNSKVTISIGKLSDAATRITVKARRFNMPRISTAQEVFVKIMTRLTGK